MNLRVVNILVVLKAIGKEIFRQDYKEKRQKVQSGGGGQKENKKE